MRLRPEVACETSIPGSRVWEIHGCNERETESAGTDANKTPVEEAQATRVLAEQGELGVHVRLSWMYANGYGVARNEVNAIRWLRTAPEKGSSWAQYRLGQRYEDGVGLVQD